MKCLDRNPSTQIVIYYGYSLIATIITTFTSLESNIFYEREFAIIVKKRLFYNHILFYYQRVKFVNKYP